MKKSIIATIAAGTLVLGVSACSKEDTDKATDSAKNAGASATEMIGDGADKAGDAASSATSAMGDSGTESSATTATSTTGAADATKASGDTEMAMIPSASGEISVPASIAAKYNEFGGASGYLGQAMGEPTPAGEGTMVKFAGGMIISNSEGQAYIVQGKILDKYEELGGPTGELGLPTADEEVVDGGWVSTFEKGEIRYVNEEYQVKK